MDGGFLASGRLYVYNTLSRSLEEFKAGTGEKVNMFVCGQTVYDDAHLGHAKTYVDFDVIARWIRHLGYKLTYIQNITDVDDKIIARANERGVDPSELARRYEGRLLEDMKMLGVESVDSYPRSHDYIDSIEGQIRLLVEKGYAYVVGDNVYYDVDMFPDYNKLSGMKIEELKKHRIEVAEGKKNPYDFVLWKAAKDGEPSWSISIPGSKGAVALRGRPGWHIEDTAIAHAIFGAQYDVHGGAIELLFPHHSNEIAQAEAAFGVKPFVRYWMHSGVLNVSGVKMSKSLSNFVTIREALKTHSAEALRLMILSTHYRKDINYSESVLDEAEKRLAYLYSSLGVLYNAVEKEDIGILSMADTFESEFGRAMNNDFDTPLAIGLLAAFVAHIRKEIEAKGFVGAGEKGYIMGKVLGLANVLGILVGKSYMKKVPADALRLMAKREGLRQEGFFDEADKIREELKKQYGIIIEDAEYGTIWYNAP